MVDKLISKQKIIASPLPKLNKYLSDDDIEEIMINGIDNIFIISREKGKIKLDFTFTVNELADYVAYVIEVTGRNFKSREFIDGILPDGSRVNIVSKNVAKEYIITLRKYTQVPLTILDLIQDETLSVDVAAYLWTIIEGFGGLKPVNIFICGGTATGKTTFLNILLKFIPLNQRLIVIEDTRELNLSSFENSVRLVSDISNPDNLLDITINTLRMRPDRIIIGEVRGKEAKGLFAAMETGHDGCMATLHANNSADVINKLLSEPMKIPEVNISLLNVIVMLKREWNWDTKKTKRRVTQVSEISRIGNINLNHIYDTGKNNDNLNSEIKLYSSKIIEEFAEFFNISKNEVIDIIGYRAQILDHLVKTNKNKKYTTLELIDIFNQKRLNYISILEDIKRLKK